MYALRRLKITVNGALKDEIASLHAFSQVSRGNHDCLSADKACTQKTFTPEQFKNVNIQVQDNGSSTPSAVADA